MGGECDKAGITWLIIVYLVVTFFFVFFTMYTAVDITAAIVDIQCIALGRVASLVVTSWRYTKPNLWLLAWWHLCF